MGALVAGSGADSDLPSRDLGHRRLRVLRSRVRLVLRSPGRPRGRRRCDVVASLPLPKRPSPRFGRPAPARSQCIALLASKVPIDLCVCSAREFQLPLGHLLRHDRAAQPFDSQRYLQRFLAAARTRELRRLLAFTVAQDARSERVDPHARRFSSVSSFRLIAVSPFMAFLPHHGVSFAVAYTLPCLRSQTPSAFLATIFSALALIREGRRRGEPVG